MLDSDEEKEPKDEILSLDKMQLKQMEVLDRKLAQIESKTYKGATPSLA